MITLCSGGLPELSGALSRSHARAACGPLASAKRTKTTGSSLCHTGFRQTLSQSSALSQDQHHNNGGDHDDSEPKDSAADNDDVQMG